VTIVPWKKAKTDAKATGIKTKVNKGSMLLKQF
jgi:hypothetical protein